MHKTYLFSTIVLISLLVSSCSIAPATSPLPELPTFVPTPAFTFTSSHTSMSTITNTPLHTATPTLEVGSTQVREADGMVMVYVPAGEFEMGSTDLRSLDQQPVHQVYLDAYWIDSTEITNGMYMRCVAEGECDLPDDIRSYTRGSYYGNDTYADYPVIYVSWSDAQAYCAWAGAGLPTEAEWEKAARGDDGRIYPWGDEFNCHNGNFDDETQVNLLTVVGGPDCDHYIDTAPVGSFQGGVSPYGAYDLAGNVWEWVADWYDATYYDVSPTSNPLGPSSGEYRLLRGGAWQNREVGLHTYFRAWNYPSSSSFGLGFRCSRGTSP